jgi:hypothetical protein
VYGVACQHTVWQPGGATFVTTPDAWSYTASSLLLCGYKAAYLRPFCLLYMLAALRSTCHQPGTFVGFCFLQTLQSNPAAVNPLSVKLTLTMTSSCALRNTLMDGKAVTKWSLHSCCSLVQST